MKYTNKGFEVLTVRAGDYLLNKLGRAKMTVKFYHCLWRKVHRYMVVEKINRISRTPGCKKYRPSAIPDGPCYRSGQ